MNGLENSAKFGVSIHRLGRKRHLAWGRSQTGGKHFDAPAAQFWQRPLSTGQHRGEVGGLTGDSGAIRVV